MVNFYSGVNCSTPTVPDNAQNVSCANVKYGYQSVCQVQCKKGYTPQGPLYIICMADGYWSESSHCLSTQHISLSIYNLDMKDLKRRNMLDVKKCFMSVCQPS